MPRLTIKGNLAKANLSVGINYRHPRARLPHQRGYTTQWPRRHLQSSLTAVITFRQTLTCGRPEFLRLSCHLYQEQVEKCTWEKHTMMVADDNKRAGSRPGDLKESNNNPTTVSDVSWYRFIIPKISCLKLHFEKFTTDFHQIPLYVMSQVVQASEPMTSLRKVIRDGRR